MTNLKSSYLTGAGISSLVNLRSKSTTAAAIAHQIESAMRAFLRNIQAGGLIPGTPVV
jgi:hypothetical protein